MRINLMDGSLQSLGGHPHDIDLRCARALVKAGHDVHVYCHVNASAELQSHYHGIVPITPIFTINPYASPSNFDETAGVIIKNLDGGRVTASELVKTRAADVWLWPSFYAHQLIACTMIKTTALISGCIHHPPDFFSPGDTAWWRYGFIQANNNGLNLRTGAIDKETCYIYSPLTRNGEFPLFPFPTDGSASVIQRQSLKRVGIFGFQRQEKGGVFIRSLLEKLVTDGYEVIFHDSNPANTGADKIAGVTRLGHVMDLDAEIAQCDLVLTPYHAESYRQRSSGIVMSALASGAPVVAPYGSAPGRLIEQSGAGTLFTHYSIDSIYAAIQSAANRFPAISQSAYAVASDWKNHHGVQKFLAAMIE